jgi:uracil-DNA glycosylase family protein
MAATTTAEPFLPDSDRLPALAEAAAHCRGCELYQDATQTVFGRGNAGSPMMLVGEQPGDVEDQRGEPFVGPAGKMLDRALVEAGVDRAEVYVTNAVKHFKNEPRGKRRLHKKPNRYEVEVCKIWFDQELALVRPQLVVAMGVTAASALAGKAVTLTRLRGRVISFAHAGGQPGIVTIHPSSILRAPDEAGRRAAYAGLVKDLKLALKSLAKLPKAA